MLRRLWVALGIKFPTVSDAIRSRQACMQVGHKSYCVMNRAGFAEAFTHHLHVYSNHSSSLAVLNKHKQGNVAKKSQDIDYPCVVIFGSEDFSCVEIDPPNTERRV